MLPRVFITDGDPAVNGAIMTQFSNTSHIYCIWHICQNLPKQLKGVLGSDYNNFIKDFFIARNSLAEEQFNKK